jgi:hypothetical protein
VKRFFQGLFISTTICCCVILTGCKKSHKSNSTIELTGTLAGNASSEVVEDAEGSAKLSRATNGCASVAFSASYIGGSGSPFGSGTVNSDGTFSFSWKDTVADDAPLREVVLTFSCPSGAATHTLRCFGKAGDASLICDPVYNAMVASLEDALGTQIESDELFSGLSIATLATGLVETLKLIAKLDPSSEFYAQLTAADSITSLRSLIENSPVGALFKSLQSLAEEIRAKNLADGTNEQDALAGVWSPEKVINLIVSLGVNVELMGEGKEDDDGFYSDLITLIDVATASTFMEDTQIYISCLNDAIYLNKPACLEDLSDLQNVNLVCIAQSYGYDSKPAQQYQPNTNGQLSNGANKLTCLGTNAQAIGLVDSNGTVADNTDIRLMLQPRQLEINRNDIDGTHRTGFEIDTNINILEVFEEFLTLLEDECSAFYIEGNEGAPADGTDYPALGQCIADHQIDRYFAGVLGVYKFLTDPNLRKVKLSLTDLYTALVDNMNIRLAASTPVGGFQGVQIQESDTGYSNFLPLLLKETEQTNDGKLRFNFDCPTNICSNGQLPSGNITLSREDLTAIRDGDKPSFAAVFADFTKIPTLPEIKKFIFNSAHHAGWNVVGGSHFHIAGNLAGTKPILCSFKIGNSIVKEFIPASTNVVCEQSTLLWDADGNPPTNTAFEFSKYYGLNARENTSGTQFFSLINLLTGQEYRYLGGNFRVTNGTTNSSILLASTQSTCQSSIDTQGSQQSFYATNYLSYVQVDLSSFAQSIYIPYYVSRHFPKFGEQRVAARQTSSSNGCAVLAPICLPSTAVTVNSSSPYVATGIVPSSAVACSSITTFPFYFLQVIDNVGASTAASYYYQLIRNDGLQMLTSTYANATVGFNDLPTPSTLGPASSQTRIINYAIANSRYDSKYDPYCFDLDSDGRCDCRRDTDSDGKYETGLTATSNPSAAECTLNDKGGLEPTISVLPINEDDSNAVKFWTLIGSCGNKSGTTLSTCLLSLKNSGTSFSDVQNVDWRSVLSCVNSDDDILIFYDFNASTGKITGHCDDGSGFGQLKSEDVKLGKLVDRNNAYDIEKPQTLLKLISAATATTGTGITLDKDKDLFVFNEAIALLYARLALPPSNIAVYGPDRTSARPFSSLQYLPGYRAAFVQWEFRDEKSSTDPVSAVLRQFLVKTGAL